APKKSNQQLLQVTVNKRITERQKKFSHTTPGLDAKYDIWVSLNFTGPAFIPGDKQKNAIYIERLVLSISR
ncbi:MAG: hypothetical protein JXA11_09665, partial [Phycisphaerae bacterium]|nr:hypothetical protein [Phycisphaerae bacterium]